jgi:hypothetical protein
MKEISLILSDPLTPHELACLREIGKTEIPVEDREKLIRLGFVERTLGGLKLTVVGRMRILDQR